MSKKKLTDIIISILVALALWTYVTTQVDPVKEVTVTGVPVELVNTGSLAAGGLTVEPGSYAVDVVVSGKGSDVAELNAADFDATADMANYTKGKHNVGVKVSSPRNVEVLEIRPEQIEVDVVDLVSMSKPIKLNYSAKFPEGMEPGFFNLAPSEITVSGTKTEVDKVSYMRADIESSQLRENKRTINVAVTAVDKAGDTVYSVEPSQDSVEITLSLCHVKEVPLSIAIKGKPPGSYAVTKTDVPDKIFIRGSKEALADIDRLTADPIDISNLRATTIITPSINLPEGVEPAEASKDLAVTIEIGGEEAKSFTVTSDQIDVRGVKEGYTVHISTSNVTVTVFGSHGQIEKFSPTDLKLYIDVNDIDYNQETATALIQSEDSSAFKRFDIAPISLGIYINKLAVENTSSPEIAPLPGTATDTAVEPLEEG